MQKRDQHRQEVIAFLQNCLAGQPWELTFPLSGRGHETYIAQGNGAQYFIKLGIHIPRYQVMASLDLTPEIRASGFLADGTSILVQSYIIGRNPSWQDFRHHLPTMAMTMHKTHHSLALKSTLPAALSPAYQTVGLTAVRHVQQKWELYRAQVPAVANEVDEILAHLQQEVQGFIGSGLVASHNDVCNGNWLITTDGKVYLVDLEAMSLDDPAQDIGSLFWWYYPPELRSGFLERASYRDDEAFQNRMRVRMALHCLNILLPRVGSFDKFDADSFAERLTDFRAVAAGKENPRGYDEKLLTSGRT